MSSFLNHCCYTGSRGKATSGTAVSRTYFLFGLSRSGTKMLFLFLSPILSLHLIPNNNTQKARSGLPCKPGTTTFRVQGVARPSLPLASALQVVITRAVQCFHTSSWEFSNSLLILPEVDQPVQKTPFHPLSAVTLQSTNQLLRASVRADFPLFMFIPSLLHLQE